MCNNWNVNYFTFQWFTVNAFSVNTPRMYILIVSLQYICKYETSFIQEITVRKGPCVLAGVVGWCDGAG